MTKAEKSIPQSKYPLWREIKKNKVAYVYILPFYLLFAVFGLFPIISGFFISFFDWNGLSAMEFVGLSNYQNLLSDPIFWKAMSNTLQIGVVAHIFILLGGLAMAYILNSKLVKFPNVFKTIYFLPMVTSAVAVTIVFQSMYGLRSGLLNALLIMLGFDRIDWLGGSGAYIKTAIIIMFAWKWMGFNMVIYLAGMQGISNDIYEAATIDGASHTNLFFRIMLPLLKPIILFTLIQSTIGTMNLFTEPFVLTGTSYNSFSGGINNQGMTAMMYLLSKAPQGNNLYGYASAVAYVICFIVIVFSILNMRFFSEKDTLNG